MLNLQLMILIILSLFLTGNSVQAKSLSLDKHLEQNLITICKALKSDSKMKLKRAIKKSGLKKRVLLRGLVCNGMDPVTFALSENATISAQYMASKVSAEYFATSNQQLLSRNKSTLTQN